MLMAQQSSEKKKIVPVSWILYFFGRYRYQITKQTKEDTDGHCCGLNVVSPSNSHVQIPVPNVLVSVDGPL